MRDITQEEYSILKQPYMQRYVRLNLLDFDFNVVDELSGDVLSLTVSVDAYSDIRRTCDLSFVVKDGNFEVIQGDKIWLDKYIQPYIGTYDIQTDEIIWENQGIYLINQPSRNYDAQNNVMSIQGVDLTAKLTGLRNGQLEGIEHIISQGSNVRQVIISTLELAGFDRYEISECYNIDGTIQDVPYDIKINAGGTVWDILTSLRDILPQYQMYFDIDGVFHYEIIPSGENESSVLDDDLLNYVLLSEREDVNFEEVKNYIEVYGATHDIENFPTEQNVVGSVINMTIPSLEETGLESGDMIGWQFDYDAEIEDAQINVNSLGASNLVDDNGDIISITFVANEYYVAVYQSDGTWLFMGHLQAQAVAYDDNPDSPFYVNSTTGRIRYVCSGGEYENIQTDSLALQRAKIEVYWRSRLNDSISLSVIPIPWLEVNVLFSHKLADKNEEELWMIDSFNVDYSETGNMEIKAHKYYPYYSSY